MVGSSVVAESLKPVKLLATCKRTQQLPTMLYEVFGSNAMATKLWKELQMSLSIKVRGVHPGAEGGTWGTKRLGFVSVVAFFLPSKSQYAWVRQCEISFLLTSTSRGGLTYGRTDGHVTTKFSCMM